MEAFRSSGAAVALVSALLLSACSSAPTMQAQWVDPAIHPGSATLHGAKVLVVCDALDLVIRRICQDRVAAQVSMRGAAAIPSTADGRLSPDTSPDAQLALQAQSVGANAVLLVITTPVVGGAASGMTVGLGGFSFGGGGGGGGVGVGLTAPVGGYGSMSYAFNGRLLEADTGRLLWTATVTAPAGSNPDAQLEMVARMLVQNAQAAGLF